MFMLLLFQWAAKQAERAGQHRFPMTKRIIFPCRRSPQSSSVSWGILKVKPYLQMLLLSSTLTDAQKCPFGCIRQRRPLLRHHSCLRPHYHRPLLHHSRCQ